MATNKRGVGIGLVLALFVFLGCEHKGGQLTRIDLGGEAEGDGEMAGEGGIAEGDGLGDTGRSIPPPPPSPVWMVSQVEDLNADGGGTAKTTYEYSNEGELIQVKYEAGREREARPIEYVRSEGMLAEAIVHFPSAARPLELDATGAAALAALLTGLEDRISIEDILPLTTDNVRGTLDLFEELIETEAERQAFNEFSAAVDRYFASTPHWRFALTEYAPSFYRIENASGRLPGGALPVRSEFDYVDPPGYPSEKRNLNLNTVYSYEYNENNLLKKWTTRNLSAVPPTENVFEIFYNDGGVANRYFESRDGVEVRTTQIFSIVTEGRINRRIHRNGGRELQQVDFQYDANGNLERKCIYPAGAPPRCHRYQYVQLPHRPALWQTVPNPLREARQGVAFESLESFLR